MKRLISIILPVAVVSVFTACKDDYDGGLAWRNNLDNLNEKDIDNDFNFRTD